MAVNLIAHRGWSQGSGENTLAAFARAAADRRICGVEFDVRRGDVSGTLLVAHDPPGRDTPILTLEAALDYLATTNLELFVEIKQPGIALPVIERLVSAGLAGRAVVFAFADVAASLPWTGPRPVRLGAILVYPWTVRRFVDTNRPDVILLGWDERPWTRLAFRTWWSLFSLAHLARRYARPVVVGIVRRTSDLAWLSQRGVAAAIADMDFIDKLPAASSSRS